MPTYTIRPRMGKSRIPFYQRLHGHMSLTGAQLCISPAVTNEIFIDFQELYYVVDKLNELMEKTSSLLAWCINTPPEDRILPNDSFLISEMEQLKKMIHTHDMATDEFLRSILPLLDDLPTDGEKLFKDISLSIDPATIASVTEKLVQRKRDQETVQKVRGDRDQLQAQREDLEAQNTELTTERDQLAAKVQSMEKSHVAALAQLRQDQKAVRDELDEQILTIRKENEELQRRNNKLQAYVYGLQSSATLAGLLSLMTTGDQSPTKSSNPVIQLLTSLHRKELITYNDSGAQTGADNTISSGA
jgi:cell division protein FtsB